MPAELLAHSPLVGCASWAPLLAAAAGRLSRAVTLAREARLLPWRIQDAEQNLRQAEAAVRAAGGGT